MNDGHMNEGDRLADAASLFKILGSESRLELLSLLNDGERAVGSLSSASGMSQPLVSQHLKALRNAGLVISRRCGKEVYYDLDDLHVKHMIEDALSHINEDHGSDQQEQHVHQENHQHQ